MTDTTLRPRPPANHTTTEALAAPRRRRLPALLSAAGLLAITAWSAHDVGLTPNSLLETLRGLWRFVTENIPDNSAAWADFGQLLEAAARTVQIAFLGTVLAVLVSLPFAVLGAANVTPHPALRAVVRSIVLVCRAIPDFVFALMLISAVGLGPLPGVLGIALHSIGMLGKVYAERIEEIDPGPLEAVTAVGGTRTQAIRLAVLPEVWPSLVANTLYRFDINIRASVVLGLVGAGGIGYELVTAIQGLQYERGLAVIAVMIPLVGAIELLSNRLRKRLI